MGDRMKTSALLGFHFLLVCKHCKQVFDNFKHLKSHLRKIHQVQTSSKSTTSSAKKIKMDGSMSSQDSRDVCMAPQRLREVPGTSQISRDTSVTSQKSHTTLRNSSNMSAKSRKSRYVPMTSQNSSDMPMKSEKPHDVSVKSQKSDVPVTSLNRNSSLTVDGEEFTEEEDHSEEIRPPLIPECISPPDKIPKGYKLCTECPRVIRYPAKGPKTEYNAHLDIHSGICTFVCPYCLFGFVDPVSLLSHTTQNHTGILAFECETCAKPFKTMKGLQIHQRLKKECKIRDANRI